MAKHRRSAGTELLIPIERIERQIYAIRGAKVMISTDLAELYGVSVSQLNQAVKRNLERFPRDFMFALTRQETVNLKSQIVTSSWGGARCATPYAFTEEGVAMLSAVLRSETAVAVSIQIMRAFVRLRQMLSSHEQLRKKMDAFEKKLEDHDQHIGAVFDMIRQLMDEDEKEKRKPPIGYSTEGGGAKGRMAKR